MRKGLYIVLPLFSVTACLGPEIGELEFFEVALQRVESSAELGTVELSGLLSGNGNIAVEEHGFIWAPTVDALEALSGEAQWISLPGAPANSTFEASASGFSLDAAYYFRAYATTGERRALSPIQSFSLGVNVSISRAVFIDNDSAVLTGFIQGLQQPGVNISVSEHGFVVSKTNAFPEYGADSSIPLGALNDDRPFKATAHNMEFNQLYYARAFVKPQGLPPYYSDSLSFRIADGWKAVSESPAALFYASSASAGGKGYVVFGCLDVACLSRSNKLWEYGPGQNGWNEKAPFPGQGFPTRYNATAFAIRDTLYVGFGKDPAFGGPENYLRHFWWIAPNGSNTWMELENQPPGSMPRREGASAFVIDDKAYMGGGKDLGGTAFNDFWQYDSGTRAWRQVAGLWRAAPGREYKGRFEAVAFAVNGKGYLGAGADAGLTLQDFWEFTPPANAQDTGSWRLHSYLPGPPRFAAAGFAIGEKGYVGGGQLFSNSFYLDDFWEFDPSRDGELAWAAVSRFRGKGRARAFSFAIGGKGYIGGGETRELDDNNFFFSKILKSLWAYTPRQ